MSEKSSISILDRIFKEIFSERIERIKISTYEEEKHEFKKEIAELKRGASYDSLTGALSRVGFEKRVKYFLSVSNRFSFKFKSKNNLYFSIVFIDIDKFKDINDTYGHEAGDNILKNFVSFLSDQLRDSDLIGRLGEGSDEFLLFLEDSDFDSSVEVIRNIQSRLEHNLLSTGDEDIQVSFSFGIASTSEGISDLDKLKKTADREMYKQKNGNNR